MRVIVIGSGIAGVTTAIALRRAGLDVAVYERFPESTEVGAGISLWSNALRALESIDAAESILDNSETPQTLEFRVHSGRWVTSRFIASDLDCKFGFHPWMKMIHRAKLLRCLTSLLPDGCIRFGHELVDLHQSRDNVTARFANGIDEVADVIIGADGMQSPTRRLVFGAVNLRYSGYTCWRGLCDRPISVARGYLSEFWGRGARFGITTLPEDRVYWWATKNLPPDQGAANKRGHLTDTFAEFSEPVPELIRHTPDKKATDSGVQQIYELLAPPFRAFNCPAGSRVIRVYNERNEEIESDVFPDSAT